MENISQEYFVSFQRMFFLMGLNILPLLIVIIGAMIWLVPQESFLRLLIINLIIALLITAIASYLSSFRPRVYINDEGIKAHDRRGRLTFMKWNLINAVRYQNRFGVEYIFIKSENSNKELVVPLFISEVKSFQDAVFKFAGKDNPVSKNLHNI